MCSGCGATSEVRGKSPGDDRETSMQKITERQGFIVSSQSGHQEACDWLLTRAWQDPGLGQPQGHLALQTGRQREELWGGCRARQSPTDGCAHSPSSSLPREGEMGFRQEYQNDQIRGWWGLLLTWRGRESPSDSAAPTPECAGHRHTAHTAAGGNRGHGLPAVTVAAQRILSHSPFFGRSHGLLET